jgi:signal transduction histidine kinase
MKNLDEILQQYGRERTLAPGEVLLYQGAVSDGVYYLRSGRLGVYKEEGDASYFFSQVEPGDLVGELGAATGWSRSATVKAEEESRVVHISEADFRRAMGEAPGLAAEVICSMGEWLAGADVARVNLGRSYQQASDRVEALCSEKERLEELLRLREELADMIIHDLRNPLGVISSTLELLRHVPVAGAEQEYVASVLGTMGRSVRRMQRLVDTLLDIARLEEGAMALGLLPLDLGGLVGEVLSEERPLAEKKGVTLESQLPSGLPPVLADHDVLLRVLINLVDNALKFTPRGERVWVAAQAEGEGVRVEVVDAGPGIPVAERTRVFEKFTQVQGRAEIRRGVGLGLSFCRMAVEAHGGHIWVEDGPGGSGSRFLFTLPQAQRP